MKSQKVTGSIFEVFFGSFPSASSRHLAISTQQKTGSGVTPVPSGEIQKVARGERERERRGGGVGGCQRIPYKVENSFSFSSSWLIEDRAIACDDALSPLSKQNSKHDKHIN